MSIWKKLSLALVATIVLGPPSPAQTNRATLEGTVMDPSSATISGASVKILAVDTGLTQQRTTNPNGQYRFPGIATGIYTVTISNSGFKTKVIEDVILDVGQTRTLDVSLQIGEASEKVDVMVEAGPAERSSAEATIVIRTDQIANLPVNGRDWSALTMLAPFAQDDGGANQRTIRFAGRAIDDNNFNIDGVDAGGIQEQAQKSQTRLQISEDAIAEYRVNSALYDAEYGAQAGGQINVVTKSGTNEIHGTAFGYLRNSVFDARNFNDFNTDPVTGNQIPVIPPFRLGQYGLTVGGPIKKDNTFFFLSYEGLRQLQSFTQQPIVPSAQLLADILVNGRGGQGPAPQMCSILQVFPWRASTGTLGGCAPRVVFPDAAFVPQDANTDLFSHTATTTIHEDTALIRIDHKFSDKTTLYGRAQRDIALSDTPNGALFDKVAIINHPANYFLALQHIFTSNLFNEGKVYVNRSPFHNPNTSILPYSVKMPFGIEGLNNDNADIEVGTTFGFIDNLTWTHSRHTFKMGMEIRRIRLNQGKTADNALTFGDPGVFSASLDTVKFNAPWCCHKYRRAFYMPYFQDEWKVTPTFTANLGIRWDYYGVENVPDNRTTVFDFNQFHGACLGSGSFNTPFPVPINTPPCPKNPSLYDPNYRNFDPRVSFAWAPSALHGKTVIRSGFGIYSGAAQNDDLNAGLESDTFVASLSNVPLSASLQQAVPDVSGFSRVANHPRALQRHGRRDQYVETWGLTIEHELPSRVLLAASYLGTHGVRLFSRGAVNLCTIPVTLNSAGNDCIRPLDQYFPDPANPDPYGSVDYKSDTGLSSYHALLVSLERRFSSGFSFQTRYTWSHSINDGAIGGGEANGQQNVNCRQCDKGDSATDVRNNFTANAVYQLPFGPGKAYLHDSGVLGKIAGGWEVSTLGTWHTGHPLTVNLDLSGNITSGPFTGFAQTFLLPDGNDQTNQRPDIVPGVPLYLPAGTQPGVPLINPAAFRAPPVDANGNFTRFGNAGNGILRALNIWQVDLALMKGTKLTERFGLQFGIQAFNVFNHVQFGDFGKLSLSYAQTAVLVPAGGFGQITSTVNGQGTNTGTGLPRQLQFMLRFRF
jgi:carboxypeptidase family protein